MALTDHGVGKYDQHILHNHYGTKMEYLQMGNILLTRKE